MNRLDMERKGKSIKVNLIMNMLLTTSSVLFPIITFPYITRVLQPEGNGKIAFANSIITYFSMFSMLGIPTYGIRACAQVRDNRRLLSKTVQEIWLINTGMTVIAYLLLFWALLFIPRFREERILMLICSLTLFLNLLATEWLYKAMECYTYIAIRSIGFKILAMILMFAIIKTEGDYVKYAGIMVIANSGYGIMNFLNLRKFITFKYLGTYNLKKHIQPIIIFFAMSVAVTIYSNLGMTMLGFMKGDAEVGYYDLAIKVKAILVNLVTSLGVVLLPRTSYYVGKKMYKEFNEVSAKALEFVAVLSIPLAIFFCIMAPESIELLSGKSYLPSVLPMQILLPTLLFIGMSNIFGIQMLVPLGREKEVLYSEIAGAIADIVFCIVFIPFYGVSGAALGTLIAELVVLLVQVNSLKKQAFQIIKKIQAIKICISVLAASTLLIFLKINLPQLLILKVIISFTGFFSAYALMLLIMKEQIITEIVKNLLDRIKNK